MLPLDVPFIADGDYPQFLSDRADSLSSVHFSLHDPSLADARQLMTTRSATSILTGLDKLEGIPKYVLMNARLHAPDKYFDTAALKATADTLSLLVHDADISGLIFADPYYLQAFSDAHPALAEQLEAIPSVNAIIDSADRAFAVLDMIAQTAFKIPTKLVLDRSLNRDMPRLTDASKRLRSACPNMKLYLIANEGCLYQCPYKPAHDAHVAMVNEGLCGERTFAMNRDFGCIRRLLHDPGSMLASPFIRPEDVTHYAPLVDGIKLCGRNKGIDFLKRAVDAYLSEKFAGNLLDLMDAMGDLADRVDIPNAQFPSDFLERVSACAKNCRTCGWCTAEANTLVSRTDPGIRTAR